LVAYKEAQSHIYIYLGEQHENCQELLHLTTKKKQQQPYSL